MSPADRELLKLAAKAAGIPLHVWGSRGAENIARTDTNTPWNPMENSGQCFELQTLMHLTVETGPGSTTVLAPTWVYAHHGWESHLMITEMHNGNALAASRRAVVALVAAIAGATA